MTRTAIIAGASEGLGAAFSEQLAAEGHDLVLIARRPGPLDALATRIRADHGVTVRTIPLDLGKPGLEEVLRELGEIDVAVYNAAFSTIGDFLHEPLDRLHTIVDVNIRGLMIFSHVIGNAMKARGHGSLVLMSSLSGLQGSPRIATYAASKAFILVLGEALWHELQPVEVITCCAGAIRTPNYQQADAAEAPGILDPDDVARQTLAARGKGPRIVPGWVNRLAVATMGLLSRRQAVQIIARNTENLQP